MDRIVTIVTPPQSIGLTTRDTVKMELGLTDSSKDSYIDLLINRASAAIAAYIGRPLGLQSVTEAFRRSGCGNGPYVPSGTQSTSQPVTVTATGTTQGTATLITACETVIIAGAANSGVILSSNLTQVNILNRSAVMILVYPPVSQQIESNAVNAPVSISVNGSATFTFVNNRWYAF